MTKTTRQFSCKASLTLLLILIVCANCLEHAQEDKVYRIKRQFGDNFRNFGGRFNQHNHFNDRRQQRQPQTGPGGQLIFSNNGQNAPASNAPSTATTATPPTAATDSGALVFINNRPTVNTMPAFMPATTPTPQFLSCFNSCQTTPEYNPICGSNQQLYFNEQKFDCARRCGADIQIVRRGSCEGLFPMMRG